MSGDAETRSRKLPAFFGGVTAGAVLTAMVGLLGIESVRTDVCEKLTEALDRYVGGCGDEFQPITEEEATAFLTEYYSRAGGADPRAAWDDLSPEAQSRVPRAEFVADWDDALWVEVVGDVAQVEDERNKFVVTIRDYRIDGTVTERRKDVTLRKADDRFQVVREDLGTRLDVSRLQFPRVELTEKSNTYHEPTPGADVQMFGDEITVGGRLTVLCVLDESSSPDRQRWLRTPQGWMPAAAMAEVEASTVTSCDPVAA